MPFVKPVFRYPDVVTVAIGGLVEIVPLHTIKSTIEPVQGMRPYTPLELAGAPQLHRHADLALGSVADDAETLARARALGAALAGKDVASTEG